jgi:hypothetical protein
MSSDLWTDCIWGGGFSGGIMSRITLRLFWMLFLTPFAGCDVNGSRSSEKLFRDFTKASSDMADVLAEVRDADSAQRLIAEMDSKFVTLDSTFQSIGDSLRANPGLVDTHVSRQSGEDMNAAMSRVKGEIKRIEYLQGLPVDFWKCFETRSLAFALKAVDFLEIVAKTKPVPQEAMQSVREVAKYLQNVRELLSSVGFDRVVKLHLKNVDGSMVDKVCDKLKKVAPGAKAYWMRDDEGTLLVAMGPVVDFEKFIESIDLGTTILENVPRRVAEIRVRPTKLGARADSLAEEIEMDRKESEEENRKLWERTERENKEAAEKTREPEPGDSDYFEKLLQRMRTGDHFVQEKAINVLLASSPEEVKNLATRKEIAKAFRQLAENDRGFFRKEGINGLVVWGGKYSGPVLQKLLRREFFFEQEQVIRALGEIKYGLAAHDIAAKVGDFHFHDAAVEALRAIGPEAEDAVIAVGPSSDPKTCLAAIDLLSEIGTAKCLPLLSKGLSSRNFDVRDACKAAMRRVKDREKAVKDLKKQEEDTES